MIFTKKILVNPLYTDPGSATEMGSICFFFNVELVYFYLFQNIFTTIEDTYVAYIDTDRGQKEKVHFYDTAGLV